ncbi:putative threonine aspartase [Camellia lanceoleosa]|uniref:Threonine aspartase n=1 Tax=Camellia lanceoleosa TaxID=1840588 RepID=A0ACC0IQW0_9ERIC|nr:putative threonine aspartase [Camellia lanceoleosa]
MPPNEKALRSAMKRACLAAASVLRKGPVSWVVILGHFGLLERCQLIISRCLEWYPIAALLAKEQMLGSTLLGRIPPIFLVGEGACMWAKSKGIPLSASIPEADEWLVTERAKRQWEKYKSMLDDAKAMKAEIDGELSSSTRANAALSVVGSLSKLHEHSGLARRALSNFRQFDCVVDVDLSSCSGFDDRGAFGIYRLLCDGRRKWRDSGVRWTNMADEMAMVVQLEAVSVETNMVDKVDADEEPAIDVDFQATDPLQPEKDLKDKVEAECLQARAKREPEGPSVATQDSLRIAFLKEQYETKIQELRHQLSISKKHGEEMLWKLPDAVDELENRKKSEASLLKRNEDLSVKILELEAELQSVVSEKREKFKAYDRINAELECALLSLECCKEENQRLEASLQECSEENNRIATELILTKGQLESFA